MVDYKSVKVPEDLVEEIKKVIKEHTELGYRSHTEFVVEATRKNLMEVKRFIEKTESR